MPFKTVVWDRLIGRFQLGLSNPFTCPLLGVYDCDFLLEPNVCVNVSVNIFQLVNVCYRCVSVVNAYLPRFLECDWVKEIQV